MHVVVMTLYTIMIADALEPQHWQDVLSVPIFHAGKQDVAAESLFEVVARGSAKVDEEWPPQNLMLRRPC